MKTKQNLRIILAIVLIITLIILIGTVSVSTVANQNGLDRTCSSGDSFPAVTARESITFILGKDEPGKTPYYALAFDYYQNDNSARTEYIDTTCRTLVEVRDYLQNKSPGNGRPWGLINLVTHGNEYLGMSVPVSPGSKRSTPERIKEFVEAGKFVALPDSIADDSTEFFLHGCGLGKDASLLKILARAFGGEKNQPLIMASKLKEYYSSLRSDKILKSRMYYAKTWSIYYRFKEKPTDEVLISDFNTLYPDEKIDWAQALSRTSSEVPGDVFYYTINAPVYYAVQYKASDTLPDLSTNEKKIKWVKGQKKLMDIINKSHIPVEKFKWTTQKVFGEGKNKLNPQIHISGWCTVLCVVKPLIAEESESAGDASPLIPSINDTTYFGKSK